MFNTFLQQLSGSWQWFEKLIRHSYRGFLEKRLILKSGALSYGTVLSLIPLLAIVFSVTNFVLTQSDPVERERIIDQVLVRVIPQVALLEEERDAGVDSTNLLPTRKAIRDQVLRFLETTGSGKIGGFGIGFFIFLALSMLMTIEHTLNDIWNIKKGRPWLQKIILYWSVLTLGLIFLAIAFGLTGRWQATAIAQQLQEIPYVTRVVSFVTPFVIFWIGLTFTYVTVPNTRVSCRYALTGGIFSGTLLQLNNLFNTMYIFQVTSYREFYGGLGILPILLVGLYVFWLIILSGAQLTYSLEEVAKAKK